MRPKPTRIKGETPRAFQAYLAYLDLGERRSLRKLANNGWRLASLSRWSAKNNWQERTAAWDAEMLSSAMKKRAEQRERTLQILYDAGPDAAKVLTRLLGGHIPKDGAKLAQFDREGKHVGDVPIVRPGSLIQTACQTLDRMGIIAPKRIELTGEDGRAIEIAARHELTAYTEEELRQMRATAQAAAARAKKG